MCSVGVQYIQNYTVMIVDEYLNTYSLHSRVTILKSKEIDYPYLKYYVGVSLDAK